MRSEGYPMQATPPSQPLTVPVHPAARHAVAAATFASIWARWERVERELVAFERGLRRAVQP